MTPSYLTLEQQLELAKRVTGEDHVFDELFGIIPIVRNSDGVYQHADIKRPWNPSLTGDDRQKARALDCITKALSEYWLSEQAFPKEEGKGFYFYWGATFKTEASDLLTAASHALLGDKT
jgi:hypothetical protein